MLVNQRVTDVNAFNSKNATPNFKPNKQQTGEQKSSKFEIARRFCAFTKTLLYE